MTASVGLTAALRAAATPRFNQDFHAELSKTLKMHKNPSQLDLQTTDAKERCKGAVLARCENEMCNGERCKRLALLRGAYEEGKRYVSKEARMGC